MAHDHINTGRVQKRRFGQEYISLVHNALVLFMLFLMADLPELGLNYLTDRFCGEYLVSLAYCHF